MWWPALLVLAFLGPIAAVQVAAEVGKTARYEACVSHHTPDACALEDE